METVRRVFLRIDAILIAWLFMEEGVRASDKTTMIGWPIPQWLATVFCIGLVCLGCTIAMRYWKHVP